MANEQAIDTVILPQAEEQVINLTKLLSDLDIQMANNIKTANGLNTAVLNSKSFSEYSANTQKATLAQEKLQQAQNKTAETAIKLEAAQKRLADADTKREAASKKKTETIISNSQAEVDAYLKVRQGEEGIITTVNKRNIAEGKAANEATARSAKVVSQQQAQSNQYVRAQGLIEALKEKLISYRAIQEVTSNPIQLEKYNKKIQETERSISLLSNVGKEGFDKFGAAVGKSTNYFQKAFSALRQLAYILPGVGIAGILAFATGPIIDYISQLDIFKTKINASVEAQKALNEVFANSNRDIATQTTNLKYLYAAATDVNNSMNDRLKAAKELQAEYPTTFGLQSKENIINGEASKIYKQLTEDIIANAKAKAAVAKIAEEQDKILDAGIQKEKIRVGNETVNARTRKELEARIKDALEFEFKRRGQILTATQMQVAVEKELQRQYKISNDAAKKGYQEQNDIIKQAQGNIKLIESVTGGATAIGNGLADKPDGKKGGKPNDSANTDLLEYKRLQLEEAKKIQKAIIDDEKKSYVERLDAIKEYGKVSNQLIDNAQQIALSDTNLREQQRKNIVLKFENDRKDILIENANSIEKLDKEVLAKHKQLLADIITADEQAQQEQLENLSQGAIVAEQALQGARDKLINEKNEAYAKGKISEKEYNRDLLAINDQYAVDRISQELALQNAILAIQEATRDKELQQAGENNASPEELAKITSNANKGITGTKNKIGDLLLQLGNAKSKQTVDQTKGPQDSDKEKEETKKRIEQSIYDATVQGIESIDQLQQKAHEAEIARLEEQARLIDENAEAQKTIINNSLASEKTKNRQIQLLDAQTASQKKAILVAENKEKNKAAVEDKIATIGKIIAGGALAFVQALAAPFPLDTILPPIIAASSALQLATAIAAPLPKYEKGGTTQGGLLIWGEKGVEKATLPDGSIQYSPSTATLANFPKGTKITPHMELMSYLKPTPVSHVGGQEIPWDKFYKELKKGNERQNKNIINLNIDSSFEQYKRSYLRR